ncbi:hypothetical protein [Chryseobacterium indologenes]|uniref:hypothetical protein n=1 Tax=Chryseobacterium indologenes TaxID=253 RepID=UPI000B1791CA|nr:hypothetical protein [Chryseobacterium indologenes]
MKRKKVLIASIILLASGFFANLFIYDPKDIASNITLFSLLLGTTGSIISLFLPTYFEKEFQKNDWQTDSEGYYIKVPKKVHGFSKPTITISQQTNGVDQVVYAPRQVNNKGDVIVRLNVPQDLKIKIS